MTPTLETDRLLLRGHAVSDFDAGLHIWRDPLVTKYVGGKPSTRHESWSRLLRYPGHWALLGYGYWAIEEKASGKFIGEAGFGDFKRELDPPIDGIPEIGWALDSRVHGQGYGSEALRAILAWGDDHLAADKSVCLIHPENAASIRLATKHGYRESARTTYLDHPTLLFERAKTHPAR